MPINNTLLTLTSYEQGVATMQQLCDNVKAGQHRSVEVFPDLTIEYPGKKNRGDYLFAMSGTAVSHSTVCIILVSHILSGTLTYDKAKGLLEDVYHHGWEKRKTDSQQTRFLKSLLFWITLQEEINYPPPRYQGKRLPFKRYAEAIASTLPDSPIALDEVIRRTEGRGVPNNFDLDNAPDYYYD